jgi:hypothetical protein
MILPKKKSLKNLLDIYSCGIEQLDFKILSSTFGKYPGGFSKLFFEGEGEST